MSIDRDTLMGALDHHDQCDRDETEADDPDMGWCYRMRRQQADRILALTHPVEGVTLSREEVRLVLRWQEFAEMDAGVLPGEAEQALLARLGADNAEASR